MEWYLKVLKQHYADFGGRARRQEFWMFTLFNFIAMFGLSIGGGMFAYISGSGILNMVGGVYWLAILVPSIAVSVRRLHDIGKSGWMVLLGCIPIANFVLLYFMVQDSAPGNNEYGPNPKGT